MRSGLKAAATAALAAIEQSEQTEFFPYAEWRPDIASFPSMRQAPFLATALNVLPRADGYGPVKELTPSTAALGAQPRGGVAFLDKTGQTTTMVGDATGLNKLQSDGTWADVTRASGAYTLGDQEQWTFGQFGDHIVAHQIDNLPQIFNMTSDTNFADIGGSPPRARLGASFKSQYVLMNTANSEAEAWACRVNDIANWDGDGTNGSWKFTCPDGGPIHYGYEAYGAFWVGQADKWRRFTFVGDQYVIDQDVVATKSGVDVMHSAITYRGNCFYIGGDGFYVFSPLGDGVQNIGVDKIDNYFLGDFNRGLKHLVSAAIDPKNKLVMWAFPSNEAVSGVPDRIMAFYWPTGRWSLIAVETERLMSAYSLGLGWDDLDDLYASVDDVDLPYDDPLFVGGAVLMGALGTDQKFATFSGANMSATLESGDAQWGGDRAAFIKKATPFVDIADPTAMRVQIGAREHLGAMVTFATAQACNASAEVFPLRYARYPRLRTVIDAAAEWTRCRGLEVIWTGAGKR